MRRVRDGESVRGEIAQRDIPQQLLDSCEWSAL